AASRRYSLEPDHTVPSRTGPFNHRFPGISCQATFTQSLRDNAGTIKAQLSDALSGRVVWYRVYPGLKHLGYSVWPLRGDLPSSLLTLAPSAVVKNVRTPHPSELRHPPKRGRPAD